MAGECAWHRGVYGEGGMCGRGYVWQGGMCGRGHA